MVRRSGDLTSLPTRAKVLVEIILESQEQDLPHKKALSIRATKRIGVQVPRVESGAG